MKFSARTLQILRNFSTIEKSILFKVGNSISTISSTKSVMAKATIDTEIDKQFAVADLPQFLGAISMFEDPELNTKDHWMEIRQGSAKMNFIYSEPSLVLVAPSKVVELPTPDVEFKLKSEVLTHTLKALSIIDAKHIVVRGDGENVYLEAADTGNSSKSTYSVTVGETEKNFRLIFAAENIKLLPDDYDVAISARGISHFKGSDVEYWIALNDDSTFQG